MKKLLMIVFILAMLSFSSYASSKKVYVATIKGTIGQGSEEQVKEAIKIANGILIIKLDTPGGMADAMDDIIEEIMNAKFPIVVYVAPSGAQAFSAGTYILMASDIAAMAPATTIGACEPRIINPATGMPEAAPQKEINAFASKMQSLAADHGRNVSLAKEFVTKNVALNEEDALKKGVIEVIASNISELVKKINGMVIVKNGETIKINTSNAQIVEIKFGAREKIINYLTDPAIASLLLTIGLFGLIIGFFTPTFHLPEALGGLLIILALYGLSYIGINAAGILLIILGIIFMIIEAHTPTFGFWTSLAIISLIFGVMLIPSYSSIYQMPKSWFYSFRIGSLAIIITIASFFAFSLYRVAKARRIKPRIGEGDLIGKRGVAITSIKNKGQVKVMGEIWNAYSEEDIKKGDEIIVVDQERLKLKVRKA